MAGVFLAHDSRLDRTVAIQIIQDEHATNPVFRAKFEREVQAASSLTHPSIVRIYDFGVQDDVPYIVTEFVRSKSVSQLLDESVPSPVRATVIVAQVASALQFAHGRGIFHGRLTTRVVLVDADGIVKVAGFGTGQDVADVTQLTTIGTAAGTIASFTPEQARGRPASAKSDIYAAGAIYYETLFGRPPFEGASAWAVAYKHANKRLEMPDDAAIGNDLRAIIDKAMEKDPDDRFATALEFENALRATLPV